MPGDLAMARALGPILPASAVGLLPFTVFATFLVPIAAYAGSGTAGMGALRGLGGLAGVVVGAGFAPLLDRLPRHRLAAAGLLLLGVACAVGATGRFAAMAAFCVLVGAAMALVAPVLTAMAADRFGEGPAAGRAATLVSATQSLTAMLAAPVVALPALLWGWRGTLLAVAVVAVALAVVFARRPAPATAAQHRGYLQTLRELRAVPGAVALLAVALLRTAALMGYLAYLAAFYADRFGLSPGVFALVWTLSGGAFFLGNLLTGRLVNARDSDARAETVLTVGLLLALAAVLGFFAAPALPWALLATAVMGASHACVAACVVTLLVRRCGPLRGAAMGVNGAAMSVGVFVGPALGGIGLGGAGDAGAAAVFTGLTCAALLAAWGVRSRVRPRG